MELHGIVWTFAALATCVGAVVAALMQAIVYAAGAPTGARLSYFGAGLLGPLAGSAWALLALALVFARGDIVHAPNRELLDQAWPALPILGIVTWLIVNGGVNRRLAPRPSP